MNLSTVSAVQQTTASSRNPLQSMELAARQVERSLTADSSAPTLLEQLNVTVQTGPSASGLADADYARTVGLSLGNVTQVRMHSKVPLPPEIKEHFGRILWVEFRIVLRTDVGFSYM